MASIEKLNMFSQAGAIQGIQPQKSGMVQAVANKESENPVAPSKSNTVGINTAIGVDDTSYVSNQLGKSGMGRTLAFA